MRDHDERVTGADHGGGDSCLSGIQHQGLGPAAVALSDGHCALNHQHRARVVFPRARGQQQIPDDQAGGRAAHVSGLDGRPKVHDALVDNASGILGRFMNVIMNVVFPYIILGAMFGKSAGGQTLIKLAFRWTRHMRGGPAHAAIFSSAMCGTITGGPVVNLLSTGVLTIPMMIKRGFSKVFAGGMEAAPSSGGSLVCRGPVCTELSLFAQSAATGEPVLRKFGVRWAFGGGPYVSGRQSYISPGRIRPVLGVFSGIPYVSRGEVYNSRGGAALTGRSDLRPVKVLRHGFTLG